MVVFVQVGERGEAVGGDLLGLAAAVHLRVDRQSAATHGDDLTLESDDVARENRKLEVDAVEHKKDGVFGINILRYSEIGALQEPLRATTREKGLMVVQVSEFDQSLGIGCFHISCQFAVISCQLYLDFQSVVGKHHAVGEFAVDVRSKTHAVTAMCEPGLLCPYPSGDLNSLVQGKMRVVFLLL